LALKCDFRIAFGAALMTVKFAAIACFMPIVQLSIGTAHKIFIVFVIVKGRADSGTLFFVFAPRAIFSLIANLIFSYADFLLAVAEN
jgi:hypothetical protein